MREHYGDNGMSLAVINDTDGYVNVRANPSINAPVIAIILEDVTFVLNYYLTHQSTIPVRVDLCNIDVSSWIIIC